MFFKFQILWNDREHRDLFEKYITYFLSLCFVQFYVYKFIIKFPNLSKW